MLRGSRLYRRRRRVQCRFWGKAVLFGVEELSRRSCEASAAAPWSWVHLRCFSFCHPSCAQEPCGEQSSCVPLLLEHMDVVNCTSGGPGHMKCAVTCQRGFALQASSGPYLRPMQVSWISVVIRTGLLGTEGPHAPLPGPSRKGRCL